MPVLAEIAGLGYLNLDGLELGLPIIPFLGDLEVEDLEQRCINQAQLDNYQPTVLWDCTYAQAAGQARLCHGGFHGASNSGGGLANGASWMML